MATTMGWQTNYKAKQVTAFTNTQTVTHMSNTVWSAQPQTKRITTSRPTTKWTATPQHKNGHHVIFQPHTQVTDGCRKPATQAHLTNRAWAHPTTNLLQLNTWQQQHTSDHQQVDCNNPQHTWSHCSKLHTNVAYLHLSSNPKLTQLMWTADTTT